MSCGRTVKLEALVAGELSPDLARELRSHARGCTRCRHELNWLESEQALFRQRASREEVAHLWAGVATRAAPRATRTWSRVAVALAASLLLVLAMGRLAVPGGGDPASPHVVPVDAEHLQSVLAQSVDLDERCSLGAPGSPGFHCAAPLPASLLASR